MAVGAVYDRAYSRSAITSYKTSGRLSHKVRCMHLGQIASFGLIEADKLQALYPVLVHRRMQFAKGADSGGESARR